MFLVVDDDVDQEANATKMSQGLIKVIEELGEKVKNSLSILQDRRMLIHDSAIHSRRRDYIVLE